MGNPFKKFDPCCTYNPPTKWVDGFTPFEIVNKVKDIINDFIDYINGLQGQIDAKEDSVNITNNRKLSENGDFTGTWFGESKESVDLKIAEGLNNYNELIEYLKANPQISYVVWDGSFFLSPPPTGDTLDGGSFADPNIDETDGGLFIYPCTCI